MARHTPIIRAGSLILEPSNGGEHMEIPAGSDAWFTWLESARTFAFEDSSGRFTARKKLRWGADYWYAFRRRSGQLYETYLGRAHDITLGRLRSVATKLNQLAGRTSGIEAELPADMQPADMQPEQADDTSLTVAYASVINLKVPQVRLPQPDRTAAVNRLAQAHQALLWLLEGDVAAASAWAREIEHINAATTPSKSELPSYMREWEEIVLARVYLTEHRASDALALLDPLSEAAEAGGHIVRLLEILVLQAVAHDTLGDTSTALSVLQQAVVLGEPQRFVRTFLEGGSAVGRLLSLLQADLAQRGPNVRQHRDARLRQYLRTIVDAYVPADQRGSHRRISQISDAPVARADEHTAKHTARPSAQTLTRREREVIRLIAEGASNNDVARMLVIAPSTAKRHMSNIFAKLEVRSRTQAIVRARELGLLSSE